MATLLLLRHGLTRRTPTAALAGRQPVELDDSGRAQAAAVGERLAVLPLAAVVTSPLDRCGRPWSWRCPQAAPGRRGRADRVRLRRLGRAADQEAGQGPALAGGAAASERRGLPERRVDGGDVRPGRSRRSAPGTPGHRRARPGGALAGLQPRRRDQGDPGRRAGPAPGPVPADRGRPGSVSAIRYTPTRPFWCGSTTPAVTWRRWSRRQQAAPRGGAAGRVGRGGRRWRGRRPDRPVRRHVRVDGCALRRIRVGGLSARPRGRIGSWV